MMGPDYVQWHGFYEIAERFYFELVPEAEHLMPGVTKDIMERLDHKWLSKKKLSKEDREKIIDWLVLELGVTPEQFLDQPTVTAIAPFVVAMLVSSVYFQLR